MTQLALEIVQHTPWWVFGLCALLVGLGLQAARPRRAPLRRLLITPLVFVGWGLAGLAQRAVLGPLAGPVPLAAWLAAAALGALLGLATTRLDGIRVDRARGIVELPGSWLPLVRNLAIFAARYGLAVAGALAPAAQGPLMLWDLAMAGLGTGYFVGWLIMFAQRYRHAAPQDDAAVAAGARP